MYLLRIIVLTVSFFVRQLYFFIVFFTADVCILSLMNGLIQENPKESHINDEKHIVGLL